MDNETLNLIKAEIASIRDFASASLLASFAPVKEEQDRLAKALVAVQNRLKAAQRADLLRSVDDQRRYVLAGKYQGYTPATLRIAASFQRSVATTPEAQADPIKRAMLEQWKAALAAAMDSTTTGYGDELVDTKENRDLWMDVNLETSIASLIQEVAMPSNPYDLPTELGDINFYPGTQNVAATETRLATGKKTLTAYELVGVAPWSYDLSEESVVAMMPAVLAQVTRNSREILDDVILCGDTSVTNGINSDGATIATTDAGKGQWLLGFDGLIHAGLIDNTAMATNHNAAASAAMFNTNRGLLGKYAVRPSECVHIMDIATYIKCMTLTEVKTLDVFGPQATILTGQLAAIEGVPIIVSEKMLKAASDGKVTDGTAGTTGRVLTFNKTQWMRGSRREISIEVVPEPIKRQHTVVISFRTALIQRATLASQTHTAVTYNITGV